MRSRRKWHRGANLLDVHKSRAVQSAPSVNRARRCTGIAKSYVIIVIVEADRRGDNFLWSALGPRKVTQQRVRPTGSLPCAQSDWPTCEGPDRFKVAIGKVVPLPAWINRIHPHPPVEENRRGHLSAVHETRAAIQTPPHHPSPEMTSGNSIYRVLLVEDLGVSQTAINRERVRNAYGVCISVSRALPIIPYKCTRT